MKRKKKNRKFLLQSLGIDTKKYKPLPTWADFKDSKTEMVDRVVVREIVKKIKIVLSRRHK